MAIKEKDKNVTYKYIAYFQNVNFNEKQPFIRQSNFFLKIEEFNLIKIKITKFGNKCFFLINSDQHFISYIKLVRRKIPQIAC